MEVYPYTLSNYRNKSNLLTRNVFFFKCRTSVTPRQPTRLTTINAAEINKRQYLFENNFATDQPDQAQFLLPMTAY